LFKAPLQILAAILLAACWAQAAHAEKRVALIIGNSAYENVGRLANPTNDAGVIAATLTGAGFDVVELKRDLKVVEMRRVLRDFSDVARDADVAIVYYAGHGIEIDGTNYVIPTDAMLERDIDAYDEAITLDRLLTVIEPARQLRLVILDACRDNPFSPKMRRTIGARAISRGLAKVEPTNPNTLIAFASKAGSTASDGEKNSPFTSALVKHLVTPGLDLRKAFGYVRDDVLRSTGNKQEPYVYGSLGGDDFPLVPAQPKPAAAAGPQANPQDAVRRDYEFSLQLGTRDGWTAFLSQYPDGFYANLAKGQLNKIAAEEARAAAVDKARQAEDEKTRLAADRANKAEQQKAAAAAKAAEDARVAAENAKRFEEAKTAAAEQRRKDAEAAVAKALADKQAAEKALADRIADEKAKADQAANQSAKLNADKPAGIAASDDHQKVAALTPADKQNESSPREVALQVQAELRRVGCLTSQADGEWNTASQRSLTLFNKYAATKFDVKLAGPDVLDAVKAKSGRVCPLVCEHGYKADGDSCVKIACRTGYRVNDDNECVKEHDKRPVATRDERERREPDRKPSDAVAPPRSQASGQIFCNQAGCHPVRSGCRLVQEAGPATGSMGGPNGHAREVCN
jgi:uncharacterized caspase-like protein